MFVLYIALNFILFVALVFLAVGGIYGILFLLTKTPLLEEGDDIKILDALFSASKKS